MASHPQGAKSLAAMLSALTVFVKSCISGTYLSVTDKVFQGRGWPFRRIIVVHIIRQLMPQLVFQSYFHDLLPTTGDEIRSACHKARLPLNSHVLAGDDEGRGATLHEIRLLSRDSPPQAPIVLYLHGGGYHVPLAAAAQFPFATLLATQVNASSLFILEYTLTPHAKYPAQLRQAGLALRHLLTTAGHQPRQIVLAGDSAGGNLVLALLAHLIRPHPSIAPVTLNSNGDSKLRAALCVSPMITQNYTSPSFGLFEQMDVLVAKNLKRFTDLWEPEAEVWADMLKGEDEFWSRVPVEKVLVTGGEMECLRDGIVEFGDLLRAAAAAGKGLEVDCTIGQDEVHAQSALDLVLGLPPGQTMNAIVDWLKKVRDECRE